MVHHSSPSRLVLLNQNMQMHLPELKAIQQQSLGFDQAWNFDIVNEQDVILPEVNLSEANSLASSSWNYRLEKDSSSVFVLQDTQGRKLKFDFDADHIDYFRKGHRGKQELIAKALGAHKGVKRILDLSAGLGQDAVFLSQIGLHVSAIERNPLIYFLLSQALQKSIRKDLSQLRFILADSLEYVRNQNLSEIDAIYFDPMYPHKKKSALPRQEMVLFRDLVGDDLDSERIVQAIFDRAKQSTGTSFPQRLVVKRPIDAEAICDSSIARVSHRFEGKTVRYDMYSLNEMLPKKI